MIIKYWFLLTVLSPNFCRCLAPAKHLSPAAQPENTEPERLESDGSLDSLLRVLIGENAPVYDTSFLPITVDREWTDRRIAGKCRSAKSLKYPGMQVVVHQYYPECPRSEPREFYGYQPERVEIKLNDVLLDPAEHRYQNSGDSVWLGWYFSGEGWEKMTFNGQDWYVNVLEYPACNGSGCKIMATLLAKIDPGPPEFYFFDQFQQPCVLADSDDDGRLEWLQFDYGDWQQDTINLKIVPYEWNNKGQFRPMKDAAGKPYQVLIRHNNGPYKPRHARIVRKHWPR